MVNYRAIPEYPSKVSTVTILTRILDGLGFRFYWATEGLRADYEFRPSPDSRSIEEIVRHIWGLVNWIIISVTDIKYRRPVNQSRYENRLLKWYSISETRY